MLLRTAEFLAIDTETNGCHGDACELTEVGAVLVGGGELHDRYETLVSVRAPLSRGIQRFTGITQSMVDEAPPAEIALAGFAELMEGRVLVAHSASFDRRVLQQAFARARIAWPDPPVLCTVALARRLAPLARQRALRPLAESLGIEVTVSHRALADAETCARVFCALLPKLASQAPSVADAVALCAPQRRRAPRVKTPRIAGTRRRAPDTAALPDEPGVYIFRNDTGQPLYVGKSVSIRKRARAHFAPSSPDTGWITQVEIVDHVQTASELGALLLEHRLIGELKPPGNVQHRARHDGWVWIRCRLDIAFPILEVAPEPAAGRAVNIGPLRSARAAAELVEQLQSLFQLRHCGRALPRRAWPSAYGQMGRCMSPCLGDLDPNAYRGRLDQALALLSGDGADALLAHVTGQLDAASAEQAFERAAWLDRRRARLRELLERIGGVIDATHAHPRLIAGEHPEGGRGDLVWLIGGRVADWGEAGDLAAVQQRTVRALRGDDGLGPPVLTPRQAAQARVACTWIAANDPPALDLRPAPSGRQLARFLAGAGLLVPGTAETAAAA